MSSGGGGSVDREVEAALLRRCKYATTFCRTSAERGRPVDACRERLERCRVDEAAFARTVTENPASPEAVAEAERLIVQAGVDVDLVLPQGGTALIYNARLGNEAMVNMLVRHNANLNATIADTGETALIRSLIHDHGRIANILITEGADVNMRTKLGWTALLFAVVEHRGADLVSALLRNGADARVRARARTRAEESYLTSMRTALMIVCARREEEGNEDSEIVKLLLIGGQDVNARDQDGRTALLFATANGRVAIAKALLQYGAKVNLCDDAGRTPLMYAAKEGHVELLELLLSRGAHVDAQTENGWTALMLAASGGKVDAVRKLLEYRPNIWLLATRVVSTAVPLARDVSAFVPASSPPTTARDLAKAEGHGEVVRLIDEYARTFVPT